MSAEILAQLDRIEGRVQVIDDRTRNLEVRLAGIDGEKRATERASGFWRTALHHLIAPIVSAALSTAATLHFFAK